MTFPMLLVPHELKWMSKRFANFSHICRLFSFICFYFESSMAYSRLHFLLPGPRHVDASGPTSEPLKKLSPSWEHWLKDFEVVAAIVKKKSRGDKKKYHRDRMLLLWLRVKKKSRFYIFYLQCKKSIKTLEVV